MTFPDERTSKAVVINLDRRPDRWEGVVRRLHAAGIRRFERFPAVDGSTVDTDNNRLVSKRAAREIDQHPPDHRWPSRGGLGCFLSHVSVWREFDRHPGLKSLWVFEDDARPTPYFLKLAGRERKRHLAAVPARAGMILLA
ncbi:MAG TPA: glycosyltransferase family 25 protein, partial [Terriglobia bacterium]|nr:glycosyltransferase family 25 protein [Terriglobia bacterium]